MRAHPLLALSVALAASCASAPRGADDEALASIALNEDRRGAAAVLPFVTNPSGAVRARAALALARIGDRSALPAARALAHDADPAVAAEGWFAWGQLGGEGIDDPAQAGDLATISSPAVRAASAFALGAAGRDDALTPLVDVLLRDPSPAVRGAAALAVAKYLSERYRPTGAHFEAQAAHARSALARAVAEERDASVRWPLAYALAASGTADDARAAARLANDPDPTVRLFVARALGKGLGPAPDGGAPASRADVAPLLAAQGALVRDPDPHVACEAALAARYPQGTAFLDALPLLLDRQEVFVRRAAVRALARVRQGSRAGWLRTQLARAEVDANPWVRGEALVAGAAGNGSATAIAVEAAAASADATIRRFAAAAAAALTGEQALTVLTPLVRDPDDLVADAAARALGKVAAPGVFPLLHSALAHRRGLVRETAAESIAAQATRSPDLTADVRALIQALVSTRGEDLAEPRSVLIESLLTVETRRRDLARTVEAPAESDLRERIRVALFDCLSDPDGTVRAKAQLAFDALRPFEERPVVVIPPPQTPPIPGVNVPAFSHAPRVRIVTERGAAVAILLHEVAPIHAENFLRLAAAKHYDGTVWHRVELNFVVQGGDHLGDGTGSRAALGGTLRDELSLQPFLRGTIGMPKSDVPDSGGSQLFVSLVPTPHLDGRYTPFGQVVEGMEVLDGLAVGDRIERVEILDSGR